MSGVMTKFYSTLASAERLIELEKLCEEPAVDFYEPDRDFEYIEFKNVSFKYDRETVLEDINLRINRGELVLVSGISGIGKSTLLKLLLGVLHPGEGEINLKINSGKTVKIDSGTRGMFAYVPQGNLMLSGTIRENLMLVNENAAPEELERAIGISCAIDFIETLPDGLDTIIGERGQGLSEGQIQRLAIARAVLSGAPILLLDEATSALDEETEKRVLNNIMALNDVTCLLISHKNAARGICGREYCIENRRIRESESAKNENL
jgi:ATP-binding cassette subfamily B protein